RGRTGPRYGAASPIPLRECLSVLFRPCLSVARHRLGCLRQNAAPVQEQVAEDLAGRHAADDASLHDVDGKAGRLAPLWRSQGEMIDAPAEDASTRRLVCS